MKVSRKLSALAALLALAVSLETGTAAVHAAGTTDKAAVSASSKSAAYAKTVYNKATALLKKKDGLAYAKSYMTKHIKSVTKYQATLLVLKLENAVNASLVSATDKLLADRNQTILNGIYEQGDSISKVLGETKDVQLRKLLTDLRDSGYKLHAIEGMIYPIIDYDAFKVYQPYVNPDIKAYINLMAEESAKPSVGDAALLISWSEVIDRGLAQEAFIKAHPKSNRAQLVKMMYNGSLTYLYYGMPNTPLFDHDTQALDPAARKAYDDALAKHDVGKSEFLQKLESWSDILRVNDDKLTKQVEKRRESSAPGKSSQG
ncbi:hypothetical protein [Paenibacillus sp. DMB20]|uniref:hypothetical protein n=1 Tax=Paenibacillus sp. DMB20 TaxID=1642570 RepID=UPI0006281C2C|nr:hypothetical protein [Paenibacillus sp. DMB20]KKO55079.1 hypothetical protein XI25_02735 [Paenibacillus sp. DMB20]